MITLLAGCEQKNVYAPPPPAKVSVATPVQKTVTDYLEFTGTRIAVASVKVRAQIGGSLESMYFTPGTRVDQGDPLFVIDAREYQARLGAAPATL